MTSAGASPPNTRANRADVVVVGAGINGLVCAIVLRRAGLDVHVVEAKASPGGVFRTEYPFAHAPRLGTLPGAHRLGFVPRALEGELGFGLPRGAAPSPLFVPTRTADRYLLANGGDDLLATTQRFAPRDADALASLFEELDILAADLDGAWLATTMPVEEVAERFVRKGRRSAFLSFARASVNTQLDRYGITSELLRATLAADALALSFASIDSPGSAAALLVRHAGRRDDVTSAGAFVRALADGAAALGVTFDFGVSVAQLAVEGNSTAGIVLEDGHTIRATTVISSADPMRLRAMIGDERLSPELARKLDRATPFGGVAKLNLALDALPSFTACEGVRGLEAATTLLLSGGEDEAATTMFLAFAEATKGMLADTPPIELVFPSVRDPSLRDAEGRHSASLLVPFVPYDLESATWAAEEEHFAHALIGIFDAFAPGAARAIVDASLLHPKKLESAFGVSRGHLGHADDTALFGDRVPHATPLAGFYACGRATGPAGGALGAAGVSAARRVLEDLELALEPTLTQPIDP